MKKAEEEKRCEREEQLKHKNFRRHSGGSFSLKLFIGTLSNTTERCVEKTLIFQQNILHHPQRRHHHKHFVRMSPCLFPLLTESYTGECHSCTAITNGVGNSEDGSAH